MNSLLSSLDNAPAASVPLTEIIDVYSHYLDVSRDYLNKDIKPTPNTDIDVDKLSNFISVRADLIKVAEKSFSVLAGCQTGEDFSGGTNHQELTNRAISILEEMTEMENQLAAHLNDRLNNMRRIADRMKKAEPVFKRYARLGGKAPQGRITRHE